MKMHLKWVVALQKYYTSVQCLIYNLLLAGFLYQMFFGKKNKYKKEEGSENINSFFDPNANV